MSPQNEQNQQAVLEAKSHVEKNIVNAANGRECVDGRYDQHGIESGFIARAGADFGYVMGLLALVETGTINLTPEEAVDKVYGAVTKDGGKFYAHTDHHAIEKGELTGCGHIARSVMPENSERYGVNGEKVKKALEYMREKTAHQATEEPELKGEHEEKGVLIIKGTEKTVDHRDETGMYFVYDADRDAQFQRTLVEEMKIEGLTVENFAEILKKQTDATVALLAKGKPVLEVDLSAETPAVKFLQTVSLQAA